MEGTCGTRRRHRCRYRQDPRKASLWSRDGRMPRKARGQRRACPASPIAARYCRDRRLADRRLAALPRHPVEAIIPVAHGAAVAGIRDGVLAFARRTTSGRCPRRPCSYRARPRSLCGHWLAALARWAQYRHSVALARGRIPRTSTAPPCCPMRNIGPGCWRRGGERGDQPGVPFGPMVTRPRPISRRWQSGAAGPGGSRRWPGPAMPSARFCPTRRTTGLPAGAIHAGLHDSNAALLAARGFAEIAGHEATVLSTGHGSLRCALSPRRAGRLACLARRPRLPGQCRCRGRAVPSARFMGGARLNCSGDTDRPCPTMASRAC